MHRAIKKEVLVKKESFSIDEKKRKEALKVSITEGSAQSFASGVGDTIISPYAWKFTDKEIHIGFLSALSGIASPIAQIYGYRLMEKYSRKKIVTSFVLLQAITWLPIGLVGLLFWKGIIDSSAIYLTIILYTLLSSFGGFAHPSWFSWMGDIVPANERGKYFGKRNLITGIVGLVAVLLAALFIKLFTEDNKLLGFCILFVISFIFRLISFARFQKQYAPHLRPRESYNIPIRQIKKENKNFIKFAYYQLFFNLAIMIASPFFAAYMLSSTENGGLGFDDTLYLIISMSSSIFYILFAPIAGKFSDKYGDKKLLYVANFAFVLSPLLWIFIKNPIFLIIVPQLVSGIANAALVIAFTNFTYSSLPNEKRGVGVAYLNILVGIGVLIGSLTGGFVLSYIPIKFMSKFVFIFIIASLLRLLVALYFLPKIKEEKKTRRFSPMHIKLFHPFKTLHTEIGELSSLTTKKHSEGLKVWKTPD